MSRMPTKAPTPARIAKELAHAARELGGDDAAVLTVFRRFIEQDADCLPEPAGTAVLAVGQLWELLQRELDPRRRLARGMFFTPRPLVQFMVRSVERVLSQFADRKRLHVVDPACGYGGFLIEAARHIEGCRLTGLEVDEPMCAVARLLLGRELPDCELTLIHANPLLAGESLRATTLGSSAQPLIPVILGNPPWSNFGRQNRGPWIDGLLADYRAGLNERKTNLADDAIKFIRWAQYWVEQAGAGVVALVTPNTWLSGLTHRRMRQSLLETFDELLVLDLHGEAGDEADENVFGVRSGVAIVLLTRFDDRKNRLPAQCRVASLRGGREEKFATLAGEDLYSFGGTAGHPIAPDWRLTAPAAQRSRPESHAAEYASFWPLDRIFRLYTSGVQTKNDALFVGFTREELAEQVQTWLASQPDPPAFDARFIHPYLLAPFDRRYVYYDPRLIGRARQPVMRHMLRPNVGLVFMRQSTNRGPYDHFLVVDCLVSDRVFTSRHGAPFLAPLWTYKAPTSGRGELHDRSILGADGDGEVCWLNTLTNGQGFEVEANFDSGFVEAVAAAIGEPPEPRELFQYLYAVAHWPAYSERFGEALRRGFPRFPLPVDRDSYQGLCALGGQLVDLHLSPSLPNFAESEFPSATENGDSFRIGGYDVVQRWAKPRLARGLSAEEHKELTRLARIGRETRRLVAEIDQVAGDTFDGFPHPPPPGVSTVSTSPG